MSGPVVILGLGFTAQHVARRLVLHGVPVHALVRQPERFADFAGQGVRLHPLVHRLAPEDIPPGSVLIHPIPPIEEPGRSSLRDLISSLRPRRILYISSTGVYGAQSVVDSITPAAPQVEKHRARIEEEEWIRRSDAPWTSLILRSAAIYGPGRGVHVRLREGKLPRGAGAVVSRIHVEDLAAILEASIGSTVAGTWPVADDYPAASEEVAAWCAAQMSIPLPNDFAPHYTVAGRRVDGSRIRQLLGIGLLYPSYREGISAILRKENAG